MANPPTFPSDGRITSLQNYTAALVGTELLPLVAPGNATAGINYNITVTQMLSGLLPALPQQNPNVVLAGPASGVATATPTFRSLVLADIPGGSASFPLVGNNATSAPSYQLLSVSGGGIGTAALPAFGVALGNGSSPISVASPGVSGLALISNNATSAPSFQLVNLTTGITGVVGVPNGGTGTSSLTQNGILFGNGIAPLGITGAPATAQILAANNGTAAWTGAPVLATSITSPLFNATNTASSYQIGGTTIISLTGFELTITSPPNYPITINANGTNVGVLLQTGGTTIVEWGANVFLPFTDNIINLGVASTNRWANGYFVNLTVSTGITSGAVSIGTTTAANTGETLQTGKETLLSGVALNATATAAILMSSVPGFGVYCGTGVPSVSAGTGSLYLRGDGATATTRMYINQNGSTTWTAVTTQT